jgi:NMT1-like family
VQIRVVPPPEMVANLRAGNVDGYLAPDPFNQRAVYEGEGFIFMLSKDIWPGHPCCAFAVRKDFAEKYPNTFQALFKAIVDATNYAHDASHRKEIAKAIAPRNFLNQPVEVLEQVLTGVYPDGLGNTKNVPDRIDFDPFPYHSMAIWILTQMKRWGYIKQEVDYKKIAQEVYLASGCREVMRSLGYRAPSQDSVKHQFAFGKNKTFDPNAPRITFDPFRFVGPERSGVSVMDQFGALSERKRSILFSVLLLTVFLAIWQLSVQTPIPGGKVEGLPGPAAVAARAWEMISDPFYDNGPNDKGIGIQLAYSVGRLLIGYTAAALVAISVGIALGLSPGLYRALNPYIQVLKPISPLAWMPLFLYTIKDSSQSAVMVIFMSSLWPILANTAFGVAGGII